MYGNVKLYSQNNITARLTVQGGRYVDFIVNSLSKYQNGVTYTDWTRVHVYYNDTITGPFAFGNGWQLDFKSNTANIEGATGLNLDTETIELTASGINAGITYNGPLHLKNTNSTLVLAPQQVDGNTPYNEYINITYHCGKNLSGSGSLIWNEKADYYVVDIVLTLSAIP